MLNSDRQFGVEIEFIAPDLKAFQNIRRNIHVVGDGSLRPYEFAGEYVSEPVSGRAGEQTIRNACYVLKRNGVDIENPATSVHIHLDGRRRNGTVVESDKRDKDARFQIAISKKARTKVSVPLIKKLMVQRDVPYFDGVKHTKIDNVHYFSRGTITRHPRMGYDYFILKEEDRFTWLRNMFLFYTQYDTVLKSMVSRSRRNGNMYCIPISDSFELDEIVDCKTMEDVRNVWYKGYEPEGHYDDSRYHNVNLHAYFDRHGTVEIRSHGGTIDANKILLWIRLHQYIADKMETASIDDIIVGTEDEDAIILKFFDFISDDKVLVEYCKRMLGYFSGIIIKKDNVTRK